MTGAAARLDVTLAPLDDALRPGVLAIEVPPEQVRFGGLPAAAVRVADREPARESVVILLDGAPVGYFQLDRRSVPGAPAAPPDPAVVAKLTAGLDAPAFADREAAAKELRTLGELAVPDLTRVLETTDSAEVRQRIEGLLAAVGKPTAETARHVRAVEVLEWVGTADAKALLKALAAGADGSRQTQEARAALSRMK